MAKPLNRAWSEGRCREEGHRLAQIAIDRIPKRGERKVPDAPNVIQGRAVFYGNGAGGTVQSTVQTAKAGGPRWREHPAFRQENVRVCIKVSWHSYVFYTVEYTDRQGRCVRRSHVPGDAGARAELRSYLEHRRLKQAARAANTPVRVDLRRLPMRDFARDPIVSTQLEPGKTVVCTSYKQFEKEVDRRNLEIYKIQ